MNGHIVGIDVGGTFTDLVMLEPGGGRVSVAKVLTTPKNQAFGVINAIRAA